MAGKKRGLGRGLDALLSGATTRDEVTPSESTPQKTGNYPELEVHLIQRGRYQPRRDLEPQALEDLASSIRAQGVIQPIVVRPVDHECYEIIAGERRWRAARMAGLDSVPVVIRDVPDEAAIAMALIENIQRENLNPMEEAIALQRLKSEFELTQQEVANAVGKSRSAVTNLLRLMKLTDEVRKMLEYGDLEMGHARALLPLDENLQVDAAREVVGKGFSVRQTEALVKKRQSEESLSVKANPKPDARLEQWADNLSQKLATKVNITRNAKGKGKITIAYDSSESLASILENLQ
ncbi:MAG: ParB/RepB/Spo0J family partition protein [Pontibacterium sp.]